MQYTNPYFVIEFGVAVFMRFSDNPKQDALKNNCSKHLLINSLLM